MTDDFIKRAIKADAELRADPAEWQKACTEANAEEMFRVFRNAFLVGPEDSNG